MEKAYAVWRAFQDRFLAHVAALLLLGCTLLALLEIFRRYILGVSFDWQQDAVTFFILSGVFLYFSVAQRHNTHLNVELLPSVLDTLGPRAHRASEVISFIATTISFLFLIAVVWWGIPEVRDSMRYETRTESLAFPMWPFLCALLVGFGLMAVTMFFQVYRGFMKLLGHNVLEEPPDAGGIGH